MFVNHMRHMGTSAAVEVREKVWVQMDFQVTAEIGAVVCLPDRHFGPLYNIVVDIPSFMWGTSYLRLRHVDKHPFFDIQRSLIPVKHG